jgi:hypothetical protein
VKNLKNILIGKLGQFPLNYVTASQEKPVEWLTYLSSNVGLYRSRYLSAPKTAQQKLK